MTEPLPRIVVAAAVIRRGRAYLVTRRQRGVHLEGFWEFPGGKCDPGESLEDCLTREIREELDCGIRIRARLLQCAHEYPTRSVELHFFACDLHGEPRPMLGQEMKWVGREDIRSLRFPPADAELIALLESESLRPSADDPSV